LNVTNAYGSNKITKNGFITVTRFPPMKVGVFRSGGTWYLDMKNNGAWDGTPTDKTFSWGKLPGDIPITGDWNGDNITETGIFRNGDWYLDMNNNGAWENTPTDKTFSWGKLPGDIPITGDWNGDNITETGIFRPTVGFYLDLNNNGQWDAVGDTMLAWSGLGLQPNDIPVTGDWNGNGITETGIFRGGTWYLDMNNNGAWNGAPTDRTFSWGKQTGDIPITGDWNGDNITETGIFRNGDWYLDRYNNGLWDQGIDVIFPIGQPDDKPVTGKW
jgi:peptidoglycan hydrolase-like protein with peptidoglycan-binding domain